MSHTVAARGKRVGLVRDLNPGPGAPEAPIIPLDQRATENVADTSRTNNYAWLVTFTCDAHNIKSHKNRPLLANPFTFVFLFHLSLVQAPDAGERQKWVLALELALQNSHGRPQAPPAQNNHKNRDVD